MQERKRDENKNGKKSSIKVDLRQIEWIAGQCNGLQLSKCPKTTDGSLRESDVMTQHDDIGSETSLSVLLYPAIGKKRFSIVFLDRS